ncbi:hypothetical protein LLE95_08900, partial [Pediococcus acidilactici]|nr:hypothetical protein [Pediococcus acidilactici]
WGAVLIGTVFLVVQIVGDLILPNITSDIINNGVAKNNIDYIWNSGFKMLGVSLIGLIGAAVNVYFAATQAQKVGNKLRSSLFKKISFMSNYEFERFGEASLITRTTNDVIQIQNVVVDTDQTAKSIIEFLKKQRQGRVTFLPRNTLQARTIRSEMLTQVHSLAGFCGVASDLIKVVNVDRLISGHFLGNTLIA